MKKIFGSFRDFGDEGAEKDQKSNENDPGIFSGSRSRPKFRDGFSWDRDHGSGIMIIFKISWNTATYIQGFLA